MKGGNHLVATEANGQVGAVLVIGGGIAGIQASLDLAEAGYYVYLVERSPSIGGVMTQLDKTFPTNDCAMCILAPKLVECGRHLNIETITYADVVKVEGEPGNFSVSIRKRSRYIDPTKCTGCAQCAEVCPVEVPSEFDEGQVMRKAIYRPFPQAFPNVFAIEKYNQKRPCSLTCPAGCHVQGYVALIGQGKYREALELIMRHIPIPGIIGRICPHPCEDKCKRTYIENPISIAGLKRFAADQVGQLPVPEIEYRQEKVAIIGSGPAGLSCAYYLALEGYRSTIFEALPVAGGMLAVGIPAYRLPREVLNREIEYITRLGAEIRTNTPLGPDLTIDDLFAQGYKAVFLGLGAHRSQKLNIPGEEAEGVCHGVDFLRELNLGRPVTVGKKVAVIGGGNVAIDAARSAVRLGAEEVTILYRRTKKEMPAAEEEIEAALEEGIKIEYLVAPVEVLTDNGKVCGLRLVRMQLGALDASGRRRPVAIPDSEFEVVVDMVIPAIGQASQLDCLENSGIDIAKGTIVVDPVTKATSRPGVFAGGDAVTGPSIAIEAVAAGREAAISIARYLRGEDLLANRPLSKPDLKLEPDLDELPLWRPKQAREVMPALPVEKAKTGFDEVNLGFSEEAARREAKRCLSCGTCSECLQCIEACKAKAIDHEMQDELLEVNVGAIVLCPGFDEFDPSLLVPYGYRKYKNVVSSIEFERILSASGPYQGELCRPSDRKHPHKVAWIQCIGSRDEKIGCGYCSSVCCTYAIKEAIIAKEHAAEPMDAAIFFMDMRTYGKDFDKYYARAQEEHKINFVRSKVYEVEELPDQSLLVKYTTEDGQVAQEQFDLVVLSVGLRPSHGSHQLADLLGIQLNHYDFCATETFNPVETSRPGVFVCGAFSGPKDIPETVMQASAAAGSASAMLAPVRKTLTKEKTYPPEIDVRGQEPRIGVFVCHCGINIGGVVDVPAVKEYAATLPDVVFADENLYTCSQDTQEKIKEKIKEYNLNRVVVASCSPRTHEPMFQETIKEAGLNRYLFEMANIRDQCSWVHMHEKEAATAKAKDLVRSAVAKARLIEPLSQLAVGLTRKALVVGGGVAGLTSALTLSQQGYEVVLVERTSELGGQARHIYYTVEGDDVQAYLKGLIQAVKKDPRITVLMETEIADVSGFVGNYKTVLKNRCTGLTHEIEHGVAIIATGGMEYQPQEYLYGQHPQVLTGRELERRIATADPNLSKLKDIVMIQCVGSRDEERPYCSRICCTQSIKNALALKQINPDLNIYILYRDIRTYGFKEDYYRRARDQGVVFLRYEPDHKPQLTADASSGRIKVSLQDQILGQPLIIEADMVALATAIVPADGRHELAQFFKVPLNEDGFFLEAHVKLRPVDFATDGVFLAGLAHSPKSISESIAQAKAAASRATTVLVKDQITAEGIVASIDENLCAGCKVCVGICSYNAITFDPEREVAVVNEALCKGCGTCSAACPSGANTARGFKTEQIMNQIEALLSA